MMRVVLKKPPTATMNKRRRCHLTVVALALQQLPFASVHAFSSTNIHNNNKYIIHNSNYIQPLSSSLGGTHRSYSGSRSRLQAGSSGGWFDGDNNNNNNKKGFLSKALDKVKNVISPKTEEQKRAEMVRKDVSGGLSELLKDAPFPVRMMGKMVAPMLSGLAESMGEQARQVEDLINDARFLLVNDARVVDLLGEPIEVGMPFQQSSSSVNINGQRKTSVQASFQVQGPRGGGVATLSASGGGSASIEQLTLNAGGRVINVDTSGRGGGPGPGGPARGKFNKDDIIDVEFVDKTYNR
uniref:Uncharacterized protein n=1 Tax=Leptocylindrus danicus TaxID=163516 RepID=A0A6U2T208_9STRA|mmetsp:Transcript_9199/g.13805  ORF Transcript_9199/g.13805 Transcript_9199/m.13805 type:complete len:297 (+) Transcript_9199:143-1033(+)